MANFSDYDNYAIYDNKTNYSYPLETTGGNYSSWRYNVPPLTYRDTTIGWKEEGPDEEEEYTEEAPYEQPVLKEVKRKVSWR